MPWVSSQSWQVVGFGVSVVESASTRALLRKIGVGLRKL